MVHRVTWLCWSRNDPTFKMPSSSLIPTIFWNRCLSARRNSVIINDVLTLSRLHGARLTPRAITDDGPASVFAGR